MISMTDCSGNIHSALSLGMSQYIILTPTSFPQTERTDAPFEVHTSLLANILPEDLIAIKCDCSAHPQDSR